MADDGYLPYSNCSNIPLPHTHTSALMTCPSTVLWYLYLHSPLYQRMSVILSKAERNGVRYLFIWILHFFLKSEAELLNKMHSEKTISVRGFEDTADSMLLGHPFTFGVIEIPLHEFKRWKAWWNSSLLAEAQANSSVCRSNRWPWSLVARKLVIRYFNSDWFRNLRFIKRRVKSFVIQMAGCLICSYFS